MQNFDTHFPVCRRSHPCFFDVECLEISKDRKSLFWKYQCGECPHAFERGNGEKCYHANPCLESEDEVCANAQCVNTPHSYTCECFNGYMKDTKTSLECIGKRVIIDLHIVLIVRMHRMA